MQDTPSDPPTVVEEEWTTPDPSGFAEDHFPARAGDWLAQGESLVRIAQIKRIYLDDAFDDPYMHQFIADLVLYDLHGNRIGRESPPCGGPRTFEPACSLAGWRRIEKPDFPINLVWENRGDGYLRPVHKVTQLAWGDYSRRRRVPVVVPVVGVSSNYDPELERRARKYAAEILRDTAREMGIPALKEKADQLERECTG